MRNGLLKNLILGSVVLLWNSTVSAQIEKTLVHEELENRSTQFDSVILFQDGKQAAARKGDLFVVWNVETADVLRERKFQGEDFLWDIAGEAIIYRAYNGEKYGLNLSKLADFKVTSLPIFDDWVPVGISETGRLLCHRDNRSGHEYQVFVLPAGKPLLPDMKLIKPGKDVNGASISPNGRLIAVSYRREEDAVRLFDLEEEKWTETTQGHLAYAELPRFSADSRRLAVQCTISGNYCVSVRDANTLQAIGKPLPRAARFQFLPDNHRILLLEEVPGLYDVLSHQLLTRFYGMSDDYDVAFASDGARLIAPSAEYGRLNIWDWQRQLRFRGPEQTWYTHRASPKETEPSRRRLEVTYHPSGKHVAVAVGALKAESGASSVGLSVVGSSLDSTSDGKVIIEKELEDAGKITSAYILTLDTSTGALQSLGTPAGLTTGKQQLEGDYFSSLQFSPDGKQLCTVFGYDGHVTLWDVSKKQSRPMFLLPNDYTDWRRGWKHVTFADEGTKLHMVSSEEEKGLQIFDLTQRRLTKQQVLGDDVPPNITAVNNQQFVVGLSVWNRQNFSQEFKSNHRDPYLFWTQKVSDRVVAAFYGNEIVLFDVESRRLKKPFIAHLNNGLRIDGFAVSHDGQLLATAGYDGLIRVWEIATGQLLVNLKGHQSWIGSVEFSPDDSTLVSVSNDGTTRFWNTKGLASGTATVAKPSLPTHAEFPVGRDGKVVVSFGRTATPEEIIAALKAALEAAQSKKSP